MLKFSLGSVPVTVSGSFVVVALLAGSFEAEVVVPWTLAVFAAILLHEAGHAFTARAYGMSPVTITLFALGGVTMYPADPRLTSGRRFVIAAAGSAIGIAVGGLLLLAARSGVFENSGVWMRNFVSSFIFAALVWGILNWIPIRPLDGGQMMTSVLEIIWPARAEPASKVISVMFGAAAVYVAIRFDQPFAAMFVAFITLVGVMSPSSAPAAEAPAPETPPRSQASEDEPSEEPTRFEPPEFPI